MNDKTTKNLTIIKTLLKPETALEQQIVQDVSWQTGVFWGKPRKGHPEGKVLYHIRAILDNIDRLDINLVTRQNLRLIAFIYDTFKYKEDNSYPRDWTKHHAVYARKFAVQYIKEAFVLDIIEYHDEAYYSWRWSKRDLTQGHKRLQGLLAKMGHHIQLYYLFFKCDTQTGDKTQAPVVWFEQQVKGIVIKKITQINIINTL